MLVRVPRRGSAHQQTNFSSATRVGIWSRMRHPIDAMPMRSCALDQGVPYTRQEASKGQVGAHHSAPAAPAFTRPSSPFQCLGVFDGQSISAAIQCPAPCQGGGGGGGSGMTLGCAVVCGRRPIGVAGVSCTNNGGAHWPTAGGCRPNRGISVKRRRVTAKGQPPSGPRRSEGCQGMKQGPSHDLQGTGGSG